MYLTMAEQSTSQQDDQQMVSIILANVGTVICFRTGNPQDERLLLPLFSPFIEQGEINNLPAYNFYAKLSALQPQEPMSGQTLLLEDQGSSKIANMVKEYSKKNYARKQQQSSNESSSKAAPTVIDKNLDKIVKPSTPSSGILEIEMGEG